MLAVMTFVTWSQGQIERTNIWYFGYRAGLDFSSGTPAVLTDGALWSHEGCASICDTEGNLLFYTNGGNFSVQDTGAVWNRNHQIMPNGLLYGGCHSAIQSSIIIPKPNDPKKYYIFTNDCAERWLKNGLMYSIVDMNLDDGLGDLVTKEVQLSDTMNEGLTAIPHSNGIDFWVIAHKANTDSFYVYQITDFGILSPLKQQGGPILDYFCGNIKASPLGDKILLFPCPVSSSSGIFDFDPSSGIISNFHSLNNGYSSGTFSPNGELLYVSDGNNIDQYNLAVDNINASKLRIAAGIPNNTMQIAPDGKIYIASLPGDTFLNAINCPNDLGVTCNYQTSAVDLNGQESGLGLPNHMDSYFVHAPNPCDVTTSTLSEQSSINYQIAPNPFNYSTTLKFNNSNNEKHTLFLYDTEGRIVRSITDISTDQIIIEKANLQFGMYFFQLFSNSQKYASGKIVIQ